MPQKKTQKVKGCRKCGRIKRKNEGKSSSISLFVRNKISAEQYFKDTGQTIKRK